MMQGVWSEVSGSGVTGQRTAALFLGGLVTLGVVAAGALGLVAGLLACARELHGLRLDLFEARVALAADKRRSVRGLTRALLAGRQVPLSNRAAPKKAGYRRILRLVKGTQSASRAHRYSASE